MDDLTPEERCGAWSKITALRERGVALARIDADMASLVSWRDECIGVLNETFGTGNPYTGDLKALRFADKAVPDWQRMAFQLGVAIKDPTGLVRLGVPPAAQSDHHRKVALEAVAALYAAQSALASGCP